ncbi:phosphonopyruvate decarboxylase [Clostridium sp. BJN0001]|uniref:phosphonopyruvate decarboxylase n=1 Tax=Clostridium sp. BJN0001 TaxID=2930219 RepID=UPI001FD290DC|nr:phosphonopyruvate decarboxylase [Clostridium sp. BJN0001]
MIDVKRFYEKIKNIQSDFFCGVPDSLLKSLCAYLKDVSKKDKFIITANEGNAIAMAAGYYLSTGKIATVFMQNSGIGNSINPLCSLTDEMVYNIPLLLIIGLRGEKGVKDEPQHKKQGLITTDLLDILNIKYAVLSKDTTCSEAECKIESAYKYMTETNRAFALVIKKGTFNEYKLKNNKAYDFEMKREEAIEILLNNIKNDSVIVSTTGMASRELFELREKRNEGHMRDFLTVGSMGHASSIALSVALNKKDKDVYVIDGDGAFIMHMGSASIIGNSGATNLKHILINNGAHDSVGGQETEGFNIDIPSICKSCGYKYVFSCKDKESLKKTIEKANNLEGPILIEVKVKKGARYDLKRPTTSPIQNKDSFMKFLSM